MGDMRVIFARRRADLQAIFERAGAVVQEGADVGGDVRVAWDSDNKAEVRAVGKLFDELTEAGYQAIQVGDDGKLAEGQRMKKFDKSAGRMVLVPRMQGGAGAA